MNEQERAEEHLRTIRRLMERGTIYRAISAPTALVGGVLSLIACEIYLALTPYERDVPPSFILLWLPVFLLTAGTNTLFIFLGAKKRKEPAFSASMKAALAALAPALMVGAIFSFCIAGARIQPDPLLELKISVAWAIFYGLGLLATSHFAPRSLTLLGWAFLAWGIIGILYLAFGRNLFVVMLERRLGIFFMALTFGLFHLIYAACAWPRKGTAPEL